MLAQKLPSWSRERIRALLDRGPGFIADVKYIEERRSALTKEYPDHWIAVMHKKVVGHNRDRTELIKQVEDKNLDKSLIVIDFLFTNPPTLHL